MAASAGVANAAVRTIAMSADAANVRLARVRVATLHFIGVRCSGIDVSPGCHCFLQRTIGFPGRRKRADNGRTAFRRNRTMLKLEYLAAFAAIAETGSMTGAAARLSVSKAVVSERLLELERTLGARLVERTTRRLA